VSNISEASYETMVTLLFILVLSTVLVFSVGISYQNHAGKNK